MRVEISPALSGTVIAAVIGARFSTFSLLNAPYRKGEKRTRSRSANLCALHTSIAFFERANRFFYAINENFAEKEDWIKKE